MDRRRDLPERQLWCAVIDRALQDATDTRWMEADSARQREVLEARQWFIEDGTDYRAIEQGFVSVTPLRSDMTDHRALTAIDTWNYISASEVLQSS